MFSKKREEVFNIRNEVFPIFLAEHGRKIKYLLPLCYLVLLYLLVHSCAQQQRLEGGPRDQTAPTLIKELSTPNFQTQFKKQDIVLTFDEFIEVQNALKQVVISPPLQNIPTVERKKGFKAVEFKFPDKEVLKEGVTYAISFGESIKDLTEGNKVENLQFLFSTGDFIDSLKMTGIIADALTGDPVEEVLFMLYENFADTVVRTEKPYYFGKTDKAGKFTINYLKAGAYKGFALKDEDLNYLFNNPLEKIGFTVDTIFVTDSSTTDIKIQLFTENATLSKPKLDIATYGLVKMGFRTTPYDAKISYDTIGQEIYQEVEGDTIKYWYNLPDSASWNFYFQRDTLVDTLKVRSMLRKLTPITLTKVRKAGEKIPLNPFKPVPLTFNHPIKNLDTALITLTELVAQEIIEPDSLNAAQKDSLAVLSNQDTLQNNGFDSLSINTLDTIQQNIDTTLVPLAPSTIQLVGNLAMDSVSKRTLVLTYDWEEDKVYQLNILPNAITDWYDQPNQDTITLLYQVKPKNDFGTINLTATEMDSTKTYWFQLLLNKNVVDQFLVKNTKAYKRSFPALLPGKYSLKVIEDLNGNGRWDSGNYDKKLQPEKISTAEIEELRAGWDVEAEVAIKFTKNNVESSEAKTERREENRR